MFGTAAFIYLYEMVVKIESYCVRIAQGRYTKEGKIERISLSGKFRRARMA